MKFELKADFQSYWHIGTGRGSGQNLDALVEKDDAGLPYVSGKTLKGLFRDAVYKLDKWQKKDLTDSLFGKRTEDESRDETQAGILRFNNLELVEKAYLKKNSDYIPHLFKTHASTTIDFETGTAKEKSLRMIEVVVPMQLTSHISILPGLVETALSDEEVFAILQQAASLITHIGANKNRGFGRVNLEVSQ